MNGCAAGKVETTEDKNPAIGVPCPAGNGIVHNGGPDEDKHDARKHASPFSGGADGQGWGNGGEHTLENGEGEIGNIAGLLTEHTLETKVVEIANERAGSLGEGQ